MIKIGIMGGTFDPIHYGHLLAAEAVREKFLIDKVIFVPTHKPPHKDTTGVASPMDRYEMVRIAILGNPYFEISDIEIKRGGDMSPKFWRNSLIYFRCGRMDKSPIIIYHIHERNKTFIKAKF